MFERNHIVCVAEGSNCQVAGWGVIGKKSKETSSTLLWAKIPIRNVTECRVRSFIYYLKQDLHVETGLKHDAMLTWRNIEKLGGSKTNIPSDDPESDMDTLTYRLIDNNMHICAGDAKTDSCQVIIQSLNFFCILIINLIL